MMTEAIFDSLLAYRAARRAAIGNYVALVDASRSGDLAAVQRCESRRDTLTREQQRAETAMLETIRSWAG